MNELEQAALAIVATVVGFAVIVVRWAMGEKNKALAKAEMSEFKRMESEIKHEVDSKDINDLVDESNKRHGLR
jgi:hypothetical protein